MAFSIIQDKCTGCGACHYTCMFKAPLLLNDGSNKYIIKEENCIGCGQCEDMCPNNAIIPAEGHRRIKRVTIDQNKCVGCTLCSRFCIAKAPLGEVKKPYFIVQERCFKCGLCAQKCKKGAIIVEYEE